MGPYHNYVSLERNNTRVGPFHGLATITSACGLFNVHLTDLTHRPDEIKYVWQMKRRWTIATFLFCFVRNRVLLKQTLTFSSHRIDI